MGVETACLIETGAKRVVREGYPESYPSDGTYFPSSFDILCDEAGLRSPDWERVNILKLHIPLGEVVLDSSDGTGGFQLTLSEIFREEKNRWLPWLQEQVKKAGKVQETSKDRGIVEFRQVETSLADAIKELDLGEPENFIHFFDTFSTLISGRSSVQLDADDFPLIIAGFLNGWHHPRGGSRNLTAVLKKLLTEAGTSWIEVESVSEIGSSRDRRSLLRLSDYRELSAEVIVVPENDRYRHPAIVGEPDPIEWENWYGRAATHLETASTVGVIVTSDDRAPLNDNFITYHISPEKGGIFTLGAPVEGRLRPGQDHERFKKLSRNILETGTNTLTWVFPDLATSPREPLEDRIVLSGTAQSATYIEGSMWGEDIYTRFINAEELSSTIIALIK